MYKSNVLIIKHFYVILKLKMIKIFFIHWVNYYKKLYLKQNQMMIFKLVLINYKKYLFYSKIKK